MKLKVPACQFPMSANLSRKRFPTFQPQRSSYLVALACCLIAGCGGEGKGPQRAAVRGMVTVDSQPVEKGSIQFTPTDGTTGPVAGAGIENGKYSADKQSGPVVGTNLVQIMGTRSTGKKVKNTIGMTVDDRVSVVPEQYHSKSTLVREVKPRKNVFDFPLSSDGSSK